jgi:hypothetical protein
MLTIALNQPMLVVLVMFKSLIPGPESYTVIDTNQEPVLWTRPLQALLRAHGEQHSSAAHSG